MFHNQWQYLHFTRRNMAAGMSVHIAPRQVEDCVGLYGCQPPHQLLTSPPPAAETPGRPQRGDECPQCPQCPPSSSLIVSELCAVRVLCVVCCVSWLLSATAAALTLPHHQPPAAAVLRGTGSCRDIRSRYNTPHHTPLTPTHRLSVCRPTLTCIVLYFLHHKIYYKHFL